MKRLWSPWRVKYFQLAQRGCVLCRVRDEDADCDNLLLARGQHAFVMLNRFPYTSGHLMVVTNVHQPSLEMLDATVRAEMMELATRAIQVLRQVYRPDGFNVGLNIGEAAGAGIAEHVHLHIVPRWNGDTNFMSTLAETRVLPEALEETCRRLRAAWAA